MYWLLEPIDLSVKLVLAEAEAPPSFSDSQ